MNKPLDIYNIPEQPLTPPEDSEWSEADKKQAVERLVDDLLGGLAWDEDCEGYRMAMFQEWESIMLRTDLTSDEAWALIRDAQFENIEAYAKDAVEGDPDRYCEVE